MERPILLNHIQFGHNKPKKKRSAPLITMTCFICVIWQTSIKDMYSLKVVVRLSQVRKTIYISDYYDCSMCVGEFLMSDSD